MKSFAINVTNVSWQRFGFTLLAGINLKIPTRSCCAILGPNGSGKSSLLALLSGYIWATQGQVQILGQNLGEVPMQTIRKTIGLVEPSRCPAFPDQYTTQDVVATGLFGTIMLPLGRGITADQWGRVQRELNLLGLQALTTRRFESLSSGEKMKTLIARALVGDSQLLLLDEPTVGLDIGARATCVRSMERIGTRPSPPTMVIVSHHLDELPMHVNHVVLLKSGRIMTQGNPDTILTNANLSELFGCQVSVFKQNGRFTATATTGT